MKLLIAGAIVFTAAGAANAQSLTGGTTGAATTGGTIGGATSGGASIDGGDVGGITGTATTGGDTTGGSVGAPGGPGVPEPVTALLAVFGGGALAMSLRRRFRK